MEEFEGIVIPHVSQSIVPANNSAHGQVYGDLPCVLFPDLFYLHVPVVPISLSCERRTFLGCSICA